MEYQVSKIDAAVDQLDWSIRLFLDHRAYIPAITLAGAAEEIIAGTLSDQSAFSSMKQKLSKEYNLPGKTVSQSHLNKAKNWLKHWRGCQDGETVTLELGTESIQYILRAIANLLAYDHSLPNEGSRFLCWLKANRPDLLSPSLLHFIENVQGENNVSFR